VRKLPAVLAVLGLAAVTLVGCSSAPASSCTPVADSDPAVTGLITVSGDAGTAPTVSMHTPLHTTTTAYRTVDAGDGHPGVVSSDQMIVLDAAFYDGTTGKPLARTSYSNDLTQVFQLSSITKQFPGLRPALQCASAGSRVVVAMPPKAVGQGVAASLGASTDDSIVAVVDVRKVYLAAADGSDVYNQGWGMPAVVRAPDGRPGVVVPDGGQPSNLTIEVLKRGSGGVVKDSSQVRVHELVVNWSDKSVASNTWETAPKSLTVGQQPKGIREALSGQTVGSQVMAIVPPADGTGQSGTQIYVFDILGIDAPGTAAAQ
jgi:peptidylprolyl isomerase